MEGAVAALNVLVGAGSAAGRAGRLGLKPALYGLQNAHAIAAHLHSRDAAHPAQFAQRAGMARASAISVLSPMTLKTGTSRA